VVVMRVRLTVLSLLSLVACLDQPVCLVPIGGSRPAQRLSELGIFAGEPAALVPAERFTPYEVNVPLYLFAWSGSIASRPLQSSSRSSSSRQAGIRSRRCGRECACASDRTQHSHTTGSARSGGGRAG
jgi:hypothetical protein